MTAALLLTIALGIGSNAAVFGFIRGLVRRDIPLPDSDRLVSIFARDAHDALGPVSYDRYLALKTEADAFETLGAVRESREVAVIHERSTVMAVAAVTPEVADLLQLPVRDGAIVSLRTWENEFEGRVTARGESIRLAGRDVGIIGVAPQWLEGLYLGRAVDVWVPLDASALDGPDRTSQTFWSIGRRRAGRSARQVQTSVNAAAPAGGAVAVLPYTGLGPETASAWRGSGRCCRRPRAPCSSSRAPTSPRSCCRAPRRARAKPPCASRSARDAGSLDGSCSPTASSSRWRAAPRACSWPSGRPGSSPPSSSRRMPRTWSSRRTSPASSRRRPRCAVVTVVCGLLPLFEIRDDDPARVLRRESGGPSPVMQRVRSALVVAEMACCCLLVISSALLLAGFRAALATSTGSRLGNPILATLKAKAGFGRPDLGLQYFHDAERAALALPGINEAAWVGTLPGGRASWQSVRVEPPAVRVRKAVMTIVPFTPEMLTRVAMPPLAGRMFGGGDTPDACPVALVSKEAADAFFGGNAVGRSIEDLTGHHVEIIGVVTARTNAKPPAPAPPVIYYYAQQAGLLPDQGGPATFQVPIYPQPEIRGVLDTTVMSRSYFNALEVKPIAGRIFAD